jgi:hypothetical protein
MTPIVYVSIALLIALSIGVLLCAVILRRMGSTGSWTPEHIAYVLLGIVARSEGKTLGSAANGNPPDRKWLLDTFAECIQAVKAPDQRLEKPKSL